MTEGSRQPNIVWMTLDSVRADHTTMGGYERNTTPNMAAIAASDGTAFDHAIAHGIWTLASSASILTGTYPSHHRVGMDGGMIPDTLDTVPELLCDVGYTTACLSRNSHLSSATGLDRGFDRFAWLSSSTVREVAGYRTLIKYLLNIRRHSAGLTINPAKHATPFLMNDIAKRWLQDLRNKEPFFLYLHYNEPHRPFYPPLPYLSTYTDEIEMSATEAAEFAMYVHENLHQLVANGLSLSESEWAALHAMYDAEIKYTDHCIGQLVEQIKSIVSDDTIIVITADHGELLGESGLLAHQLVLDDALINVPFVVEGIEINEEAQSSVVQHVDIIRTLLEIANAETEQIQGIDLRTETRDYGIAQRKSADFEPYLKINPDFDTGRFHRGMLSCLRSTEYKFLKSEKKSELFRLPDECTDISQQCSTVSDRLNSILTQWLESEGQPVDSAIEAEFTDEMEAQLQDLGYLE